MRTELSWMIKSQFVIKMGFFSQQNWSSVLIMLFQTHML